MSRRAYSSWPLPQCWLIGVRLVPLFFFQWAGSISGSPSTDVVHDKQRFCRERPLKLPGRTRAGGIAADSVATCLLYEGIRTLSRYVGINGVECGGSAMAADMNLSHARPDLEPHDESVRERFYNCVPTEIRSGKCLKQLLRFCSVPSSRSESSMYSD